MRGAGSSMKISAKAEYACLAVLALARNGPAAPPMRIREISESSAIPERYLVQILLQLKAAGLVVSTRGASGGYHLARAASAISLGEVLTAIEGPEATAREHPATRRAAANVLEPVWASVRAAERAVLDGTTIAQLAEQSSPREWII
jgi:Rrf2 family cysteine metabolism transcriptional repressor